MHMVMILVAVGVANEASQPHYQQPGQKGRGEFVAVVGVEVQLGQQIRQGDRQERAGAESQGVADKGVRLGDGTSRGHESQRPGGNQRGVKQLDQP
jgi:hypothetical protein